MQTAMGPYLSKLNSTAQLALTREELSAQTTTKTAQDTPAEDKVPEASGLEKAMVLIPSAVVIAIMVAHPIYASEAVRWGVVLATVLANYGIWFGSSTASLALGELWIALIGVGSVVGLLDWIYESSGMTFLDGEITGLTVILILFLCFLLFVSFAGFLSCAGDCGNAAREKRNNKS